MFHDQQYYAKIASRKFDRCALKQDSPLKINFRCPYCGDSEKSQSKARGWFLENNKGIYYFCHNCSRSRPLNIFLRDHAPELFNEYLTSKMSSKRTTQTHYKPSKSKIITDPLQYLTCVADLSCSHKAVKYLESRQIPKGKYNRIFYADNFVDFVNRYLPDKYSDFRESRIVLPFITESGVCYGFSARSLEASSKLRYINDSFDKTEMNAYGRDMCDYSKPYYVVEGGFDSLFLSNAVATNTANASEYPFPNIHNAIYVFDNEPRNKEILKFMRRRIKRGETICIWPSTISQKDINDMYLAGHTDVETIIRENTYKGLTAELQLAKWSKYES